MAAKTNPRSPAFKELVEDYEACGGRVLNTLFPKDTELHAAFLAWAAKAWPHWSSRIDARRRPTLRAYLLEPLICDEQDEAAVCAFFDQLPAATRAPVLAAIAAQARAAAARTISLGGTSYDATVTELDLSDRRLTALPDEIGEMTALTELDVSGNPITALPASLARCAELRRLLVGETPLAALPDLPQLQVLSAPNVSAALLGTLAAVPNLTDLCIAGCGLTELPASLRALTRLEYLDFRDNEITALPSWIDELPIMNFAWNEALPAADTDRLTALERKHRVAHNRKRR